MNIWKTIKNFFTKKKETDEELLTKWLSAVYGKRTEEVKK